MPTACARIGHAGETDELEVLTKERWLQSPRMDVPRALRIDVPPFGALEAHALEISPVHPRAGLAHPNRMLSARFVGKHGDDVMLGKIEQAKTCSRGNPPDWSATNWAHM